MEIVLKDTKGQDHLIEDHVANTAANLMTSEAKMDWSKMLCHLVELRQAMTTVPK